MKKKVPLWKSIVLIVSVIFIVVVATLAWFITGKNGSIDDLAVNVGSATYVQVFDKEADNWADDLDIPAGIYDSFKEISGNGSVFFKPVYEDGYVDGEFVKYISGFETVKDNSEKYYYEEELHFRSDGIQDVYLDPSSYINAVGNGKISGAMRIAFFEIDASGNETLRFIWAPNSTIDINSEETVGNVELSYQYLKSNTETVTIATGEAPCGYDQTYKFLWTNRIWDEESQEWGDLQNFPENAPAALSFTEHDATTDENGNTVFEKKLRVRVWLEGYDRECTKLISGQRFEIKLKFSVEEENNTNTTE